MRPLAEGVLQLDITDYDMTETAVRVSFLRPRTDRPIRPAAESDAFSEDDNQVRERIAAVVALAEAVMIKSGYRAPTDEPMVI